jgi:hypothetical protein
LTIEWVLETAGIPVWIGGWNEGNDTAKRPNCHAPQEGKEVLESDNAKQNKRTDLQREP